MNAATITALIQLAGQLAIPILPLIFHTDATTGAITLESIILILDEASARNAETLRLIAEANSHLRKP